jgi:hypothetical protein
MLLHFSCLLRCLPKGLGMLGRKIERRSKVRSIIEFVSSFEESRIGISWLLELSNGKDRSSLTKDII